MSISRRLFLLGAGSVVSSAFISRATAHILHTGQPLLLKPPKVERIIHATDGSSWSLEGWTRAPKYMLSYWSDDQFDKMTLRDFLRFFEVPITTPKEIEDTCWRKNNLRLDLWGLDDEALQEQLDYPLTYYIKHDDNYGTAGPSAQVRWYLNRLPLDDLAFEGLEPPAAGSQIWLEEADGYIQLFEYYYECYAMDDLALSLLQARLIDLGEPVQIKVIN